MKKIIQTLLVIVFIIVSVVPSFGQTNVGIILNNNPVSFNDSSGYPFIDSNGRTLVPLRQTMEAAGYTVSWDSINKIASVLDNKGTRVNVKIGDNYITKEVNNNDIVESSRIKNDTFAQIVNERTFLPIRIVLEAFGASVSWDNSSKNVIVSTNGVSSNSYTAEQIYSKSSPAVFYIEIYDASGKPLGSGSGFFINSDGTAITNFHVIEGVTSAKVTTTEGKTYNVEGVYALDKALDMAKIKVNGKGFSYVNIDASGNVKGGSTAYAIGSPLGLENTISEGIISNPNRIINNISYYQITTPISPGSSGGALFDKYGNVIGITSGSYVDGQNLNLAIPITNISKLQGTTVKKLDTITPQAKKSNVNLLLSSSNVTLSVGTKTDVTVSFENYDYTVRVEYFISDTSVVNADWGEWNGNKIPLNISAVGRGSTTIQINLYDDTSMEQLATKVIYVNTSQDYSTPYYAGLYPAPDFGYIFGVPLYFDNYTDSGASYYYAASDIKSILPDSAFINDYAEIVLDNGFYYDGGFKDRDGYQVMVYKNNLYGLTLYTSSTNLNGTLCYIVMVLW